METLNGKELAEARKRARGIRVRNIRRRIAYGATVMVAVFSGAILFRSLEQQTGSTATVTSSVTRSDDGESSDGLSSLANQVASAFGDDGEEEGSASTSTTVAPSTTTVTPPTTTVTPPTTTTAPLTTSQS